MGSLSSESWAIYSSSHQWIGSGRAAEERFCGDKYRSLPALGTNLGNQPYKITGLHLFTQQTHSENDLQSVCGNMTMERHDVDLNCLIKEIVLASSISDLKQIYVGGSMPVNADSDHERY